MIRVVIAIVIAAVGAGAQAPAFEAVSIRPNASGRVLSSMRFEPGGFTATNVTVRQLILAAYGLQNAQLVGGGPERFDVVARAPQGIRAAPMMVRRLLEERFRLKMHAETRAMSFYALVVLRPDGRLGPQLRSSSIDCDAVTSTTPIQGAAPAPRETCDAFVGAPPRMSAGGVTMAQLANALALNVRDVVLDRTQLLGRYDLELQWTPDFLPPGRDGEPLNLNGFVVDRNGPAIFTAVREQLGLELQRQQGAVEVLVIDSVSLPEPD